MTIVAAALAVFTTCGVLGATTDIVVDVASVQGGAIPRNFVGFSMEVSAAPRMLGTAGDNMAFAQTLLNLHATSTGDHAGPLLRIGGNSADSTCFQQAGGAPLPPGCAGEETFNLSTLEAYRVFAASTAKLANVSFVIDTNFGLSADPSLVAAPSIKAVGAAGLWPYVDAVEIGNEMDLYAGHANIPGKPHHRNASYTFADYMAEYPIFSKAFIAAGMPAGGLQGGAWASSSWYKDIATYFKAYGTGMKRMSLHKYARSTCSGTTVTQAELLSYSSAEGARAEIALHVANVAAFGIPFIIGEGNSASCGGQAGVSDTFTAALWALDFLPWMSKSGLAGMCFHGGPGGPYAAVAFMPTLQVRPMYYGLWVFSKLVANSSRWVGSVTIDGKTYPTTVDPACRTGIKSGPYGSAVCCQEGCGECGGTHCDKLPGGADACCVADINRSQVSCNDSMPPCVIDADWGPPIVAHATVDPEGRVKVLVVAKSLTSNDLTNVRLCIANASAAGLAGPTAAQWEPLIAPQGASAKTGIQFADQTFDGSEDGLPRGTRRPETVPGQTVDGRLCFALAVPALSAGLLTLSV